MKTVVSIIFTLSMLCFQSAKANFSIPSPIGSYERIIKVRELTDTPQFQLKDGTYYDIGSMYEIKHIFGLSFSNTNPEYVGYINSQDKYVEITPKELNTIIATTRILIPQNAKISFFDRFLSKPLLLFIAIGFGFVCRKYFRLYQIQQAANAEHDMLPWPPKQIHE